MHDVSRACIDATAPFRSARARAQHYTTRFERAEFQRFISSAQALENARPTRPRRRARPHRRKAKCRCDDSGSAAVKTGDLDSRELER